VGERGGEENSQMGGGGGLRIFWTLVTLAGIAGWGIGARELMSSKERVVSVTVTEESYLKAQDLCNRYMRTANGVIGQVALYTAVGEHISLPCRVVLNER
jgi:hypothetical protein